MIVNPDMDVYDKTLIHRKKLQNRKEPTTYWKSKSK